MTRIETLARALEFAGYVVLGLSFAHSYLSKYLSPSFVKINSNIGMILGMVALAVAMWLTGSGFPMVN